MALNHTRRSRGRPTAHPDPSSCLEKMVFFFRPAVPLPPVTPSLFLLRLYGRSTNAQCMSETTLMPSPSGPSSPPRNETLTPTRSALGMNLDPMQPQSTEHSIIHRCKCPVGVVPQPVHHLFGLPHRRSYGEHAIPSSHTKKKKKVHMETPPYHQTMRQIIIIIA